MDRIERYRGCLLGLAVGDALGAPVKSRQPGTFRSVRGMVGGGPHNLKPGEWMDNTALPLCLSGSLIEKRGFDSIDNLERCTRWYLEGHLSSTGWCFSIGTATRKAIERFMCRRDARDSTRRGSGSANSDREREGQRHPEGYGDHRQALRADARRRRHPLPG